MRGRRIGVPRDLWGYSPAADAAAERALAILSAAGAEIVDGLALPALKDVDDEHVLNLMLIELVHGLATYLDARGASVRSLADVVEFNRAHADQEMPWFGQSLFERALGLDGPSSDQYRDAVDACTAAGLTELDHTLSTHRLDVLLAPAMAPPSPIDLVNGDHGSGGASDSSALAGAPILTLPMGARARAAGGGQRLGSPRQRADPVRRRPLARVRPRRRDGSAAGADVPRLGLTA